MNSAMYKHMWLIAPREAQEYPDYSHEKHFGTNVPSFLPRKPMIEYILGGGHLAITFGSKRKEHPIL